VVRHLILAGLRGHRIEALYLTLALAVFMTARVSVDAVLTDQAERMLDAIRTVSAADVVLRGADIDEAILQQVRELEFVAEMEPAIIWAATYCGTEGYLNGVAMESRFFRLRENVAAGRMPRAAGEFLLTQQSAKELSLEVGDRVTFALAAPGAGGVQYVDVGLQVCGLLQDQARTPRWPTVSIAELQALLGIEANAVLIGLTPGADHERVEEQLQGQFPGLRVEAASRGVYEEARAQRPRAQAILQRYAWLLFASFGLLVWTLAGIHSRGRRPEWGCLLAAGVGPGTILLAGLGEIGVITLAGSLLGLAAGGAVTTFLERYRIYAVVNAGGAVTACGLATLLAAGSRLWHLAAAVRRPVVELVRARE
jgi:ABC-type lipoprotein release transport system permease subunit